MTRLNLAPPASLTDAHLYRWCGVPVGVDFYRASAAAAAA